jgi:hypothetical protein
MYAAPVAANTTGISAGVAATASNTFPGPFGSIESWGRNLQVVFPGGWDGGNVVVTGTDQFGQPATETFVAAAGSTVVGVHVFRTVTSVSKTAIGMSSSLATVGIGPALGVPFSFTRGLEMVDEVSEAYSSINTTYFWFVPGTACNGTHNYDFIGW